MELKEGEKQEVGVILQLHRKLDYSNERQVQKLYTVLKTKEIHSKLGKMYFENLQNLVEDGFKASHCGICEETLQEKEFCICQQCSEKILEQCKVNKPQQEEKIEKAESTMTQKADTAVLTQKESVEDIEEDTLQQERKSDKSTSVEQQEKTRRKLSKRVKKIATIAIALLVVVVMVCFGICFMNPKSNNDFPFSKKDFIEVFLQNLSYYNLSLGEEMMPDKDCYQYTILPTTDSLLLFENDRGRIQGIELFLQGTDDESRVRQLLLMSLVNITLYENMTIEESSDLISELAKNQGSMKYQEEEWHLMLDEEKVYYLIIKQQNSEIAMESQNSELDDVKESFSQKELTDDLETDKGTSDQNQNMEVRELSSYLGRQYDELEAVLGESEAVVNESTRYFKEYGVSCIYTATGEIVYLDCDAETEKKVSLYGIQIGMPKENVIEYLKDYGYTGYQEDTSDWELTVKIDDSAYKLTITFIDDKAGLICMAKES